MPNIGAKMAGRLPDDPVKPAAASASANASDEDGAACLSSHQNIDQSYKIAAGCCPFGL